MLIIPFLHICLQVSPEHFKSAMTQDIILDPSPYSWMIWLEDYPQMQWLGKPENVLGRWVIPWQIYVSSLTLISGSRQKLSRSAELSGCSYRIATPDEARGQCKGFMGKLCKVLRMPKSFHRSYQIVSNYHWICNNHLEQEWFHRG